MYTLTKGKHKKYRKVLFGHTTAEIKRNYGDLTIREIAEKLFNQCIKKNGKISLRSISFTIEEFTDKSMF